MTRERFLQLLGEQSCEWTIEDGEIRSENDYCPIQEVASEYLGEVIEEIEESGEFLDVHVAGYELGLSMYDICKLMDAADGKTRGALRVEMLRRCGLDEVDHDQ